MSISRESSVSKESVAAVGLALVLALGTAACTNGESRRATQALSTPSPTPGTSVEPTPNCLSSLGLFSVYLNTPDGSAYATNQGDCVNIYGPEAADTSLATGHIPLNGKFFIDCFDLTAPALRVTLKGSKGIVDLTEYSLQQLDEDPAARKIRTC